MIFHSFFRIVIPSTVLLVKKFSRVYKKFEFPQKYGSFELQRGDLEFNSWTNFVTNYLLFQFLTQVTILAQKVRSKSAFTITFKQCEFD
jgi:hypothetical protein